MYKRIISILLLAVLMLTLFTGCGAKKKIQGRWYANYKIKFKSSTLTEESDYSFLDSTTGTYTLVFNEDGGFAISQRIGDEDAAEVVAAYKELYKKVFEANKSSSDIDALIKDAGVEDEDALIDELLLTTAKSNNFSNTVDYILADLGIVSKTLANGTFKTSGNKITFKDGAGEKINMTAEYDKDDEIIYLNFNGNEVQFKALDLDH
ncbi:MAG: hypothetical protein MJ115_03915 [Clostridia bacterium]|nr:hypothetical protein [Clostridia bacterium]